MHTLYIHLDSACTVNEDIKEHKYNFVLLSIKLKGFCEVRRTEIFRKHFFLDAILTRATYSRGTFGKYGNYWVTPQS